MSEYYAHSSNKAGSPWEPLREHLMKVADRAARYAHAFGAEEEAIIAGLWHDLGKYSDLFTKRLEDKESDLDHWTAGAYAVLTYYQNKAVAAALAIQGHHIGLQEGSRPGVKASFDLSKLSDQDSHPLGLKLTDPNLKNLLQRFEDDGMMPPSSTSSSIYDFHAPPVAAMLDARMLFSTLVDADYIETEAHFEGKPDGAKIYRPEGPALQANQSLEIVLNHLTELESNSQSSSLVRKIRNDLLKSCLEKSNAVPGLFNLTAPTGSGKTLAMLSFALNHAIANPNIRRIILVVPFLSIIEQTAGIYRRLFEPHFGPMYVLEHHSLADFNSQSKIKDNEQESRRITSLLAENWDAPLILTTSVQFFESLFANQPGKCRKLHRLAQSIILFDEVQTFPPKIVIPTLAALSRLAERYHSSVVFATATQPAFHDIKPKENDKVQNFHWLPQLIVEQPQSIFSMARRVEIDWQIDESRSWETIAGYLAEDINDRSLCIVNIKRHAQRLMDCLGNQCDNDTLYHLSTNMCPAHRAKVLSEVRQRLKSNDSRSCRLISTQCVEAGVDVDFPVVWRAFGPLDAIAQAAGRCNREGNLDHLGRMVVFLPEQEYDGEYLYPPGGYKEATEITKTLFKLKQNEAVEYNVAFNEIFDIYNPELFDSYYRLLYGLTSVADIKIELKDAIDRRSFVDVARYYRLIPDSSINILVPYANELRLFASLKDRLARDGRLTRQWIRDARPLTVSLYRPKFGHAIWNFLDPAPLGRGENADDWFVYLNPDHYSSLIGLSPPTEVDAWMI